MEIEVLLSQIDWMWGAEMGANECGVVIGPSAWVLVGLWKLDRKRFRRFGLSGCRVINNMICLAVWNMFFSPFLGIIIPTDFHIFQRGRSATNQWCVGARPRSRDHVMNWLEWEHRSHFSYPRADWELLLRPRYAQWLKKTTRWVYPGISLVNPYVWWSYHS
jgi:hypothetical protein